MGQQHRKNPPPAVREAQGNGIYLLPTGNHTIRARSLDAGGPCFSCTGEASHMWSAVCSRISTAGPRPGARMTFGGGSGSSRARMRVPSGS